MSNKPETTDLPLFSLPYGLKLKNAGIEKAEFRSLESSEWSANARKVAELLACKNGSVTINDVTKLLPRPIDVSPNASGSVMRSKRLKLVGYTPSDKTSSHARRIGIYEYVP